MSYQLYRSMSLGESLQAALDELISEQHISPDLALKVPTQSPPPSLDSLSSLHRYCSSMTGA